MSARSPGPLLLYFATTTAVAWACWFGAAAVSGGQLPPVGLGVPLFYMGVFSPSLVALAFSARAGGGSEARALFNRVFQGAPHPGWYVFAAFYMAAIKLVAAVVHRVATGDWPRFGTDAWFVMIAATLISTPVQAGEEIGWRGFALPRLADRFGLGLGSVIVGLVWATWHLPLFFIRGADTTGQSFPLYLTQVTALSVAFGWLYGHVRGGLLPVMLLHAAVNNTKDIVPSATGGASDPFAFNASPVGWITVTLLWGCAAFFLARMPGRDAWQAGDEVA